MKIVLASPLYPPDIAEPAPYVKELAKRLSSGHSVTIVTYGHLPEKVANVSIIVVSKREMLAIRLIAYTMALWRAAKNADVVYAQNGPSVELPIAIVWFFLRRPLVMHVGDKAAHHYAARRPLRYLIEQLAIKSAQNVITESPLSRPEILPLEEPPTAQLSAYESSWGAHVRALLSTFGHA